MKYKRIQFREYFDLLKALVLKLVSLFTRKWNVTSVKNYLTLEGTTNVTRELQNPTW